MVLTSGIFRNQQPWYQHPEYSGINSHGINIRNIPESTAMVLTSRLQFRNIRDSSPEEVHILGVLMSTFEASNIVAWFRPHDYLPALVHWLSRRQSPGVDIGMVSVRPCVRLIIRKCNHPIYFKLGLYTNNPRLSRVGSISTLWWPKMTEDDWNWWFPTII